MFCLDLKQEAGGQKLIGKSDVPHNALSDARWTRRAHEALKGGVDAA